MPKSQTAVSITTDEELMLCIVNGKVEAFDERYCYKKKSLILK